MEAQTPDGQTHSILLQNAETVRLVGPIRVAGKEEGLDLGLGVLDSLDSPEDPTTERRTLDMTVPVRPITVVEDTVQEGSAENAGEAAMQQGPATGWFATPVSSLQPGHVVYVLRQQAARHTGISIQEAILEH